MTDNDEHPAIRAARAIKQLHIDNIKMIDAGFVFHDKDGGNVNEHMRAACLEQVTMCDAIIDEVRPLPDKLLEPITLMLEEKKAEITASMLAELEAQQAIAQIEHDAEGLPEIGNYDNDN